MFRNAKDGYVRSLLFFVSIGPKYYAFWIV